MKTTSTFLMSIASLLTLLNMPAPAQENPPLQPERENPRETQGEAPKRQLSAAPKAPELLMPYIGVLTREVSPELRAQFGLQPGFGLMVEEVMPDSPAKGAGINQHDILIALDDQRLVNMEQLMALVRSKKKGDTVNFSVISGGSEKLVPVTIGERMMPVVRPEPPRFFGMRPGSGVPGADRGRGERDMPQAGASEPWRDHLERFQQQVREYQERAQKWAREGGRGPSPQPPVFHQPESTDSERRRDGDGARDSERERGVREARESQHREVHHEAASVTRSDETGVYSLRREDGRAVFTARPKDGEEQTWTVTTPEQRRAIPGQLREKLEELERIRGDMHRGGRQEDSRARGPGPRDAEPLRESAPRPGSRPPDAHRPEDRPDDGAEDAPAPRRDGGSI